jgi:hypothetical protein
VAHPKAAGQASSRSARAVAAIAVLVGLLAGVLATGAPATAHAVSFAGADLVRLLRAMALLKSVMAAAAIGAVFWRLGAPAGAARLTAYAASLGAMAAGPGLIWGMAHVAAGAMLLHGGLAATVLLLWRDPATGDLLAALIARRRAAIR